MWVGIARHRQWNQTSGSNSIAITCRRWTAKIFQIEFDIIVESRVCESALLPRAHTNNKSIIKCSSFYIMACFMHVCILDAFMISLSPSHCVSLALAEIECERVELCELWITNCAKPAMGAKHAKNVINVKLFLLTSKSSLNWINFHVFTHIWSAHGIELANEREPHMHSRLLHLFGKCFYVVDAQFELIVNTKNAEWQRERERMSKSSLIV